MIDWSDLTWVAIAAIATAAFLFWVISKGGVAPGARGDIEIDGQFIPSAYKAADCAFVLEERLSEFRRFGYVYYPYGSAGRLFRRSVDGREFLMVRPAAEPGEP